MPTLVEHCDFCGSRERTPARGESHALGLLDPYAVVRCARCGLRFLSPRPTSDEYAQMYGEDYFTGPEQYADHVRAKVPDFAAQLDALERAGVPGRRLVEIGSAMGHFLQVAADRGWRVAGIEISRWAARYCRDTLGLNVILGRFEDLAIPAASVDVAVLAHVLEHLESPRRALEQVWQGLVPGGLVLAEVPNQFDELWAVLARPWIRYRAATRRPLLVHTHFFTPAQFVRLVGDCGFQVLQVQTMRRTYPASAGSLPGGAAVRRAVQLAGGAIGRGPICSVIARKVT